MWGGGKQAIRSVLLQMGKYSGSGIPSPTDTGTIHVNALIQCHHAPNNYSVRLQLRGHPLDHQSGWQHCLCVGIAWCLQNNRRKGSSEGFLQDLQPEEGTAWNFWIGTWEQVSKTITVPTNMFFRHTLYPTIRKSQDPSIWRDTTHK